MTADQQVGFSLMDVTIRWNSTYDMLVVGNEYSEAVDVITGDRNMNLWKFEMSKEEWTVAEQLQEVLKVSSIRVNKFIY